ncbi:GNAT family N-acetyltransferase [Pseudobacteroides cellulosolvens]|uniref:GCN5-related N-acetyltransferase n=1 Tax=Pseudobacteroides cellulosolvens ATCC 35603 = DSM 2933 TaxID=398512 RepID=A0A0L6JSX1_9FIRM|nr:GNAT family N-acetyltransferase [Pseudobacteroides cellulosolvens]KNY28789.1 GCN5-related N-acetyltransferase [Pseudobacteroides cellulosolvens ATCC 35603 = DSM 2933]
MVEKALYEDLEEILKLQRLAFQSEAKLSNDFQIPPLTQTLEGIREDYLNQTILKAVLCNKIIGSVRAYKEGDICYIGRVIVHPDHQNKGIGKLLMQKIEEELYQCSKYSLFTGKKSLRNIHFYSSLGYKLTREEYVNDNLTLIYFEKVK